MSDITVTVSNDLIPAEFTASLATCRANLADTAAIDAAFAPHFIALRDQSGPALAIQHDQPKAARDARLKLKAIRVGAEKAREALKADVLVRGRAIDGYNAALVLKLAPIEKHLEEIEKAEERREAARRLALRDARAAELTPYMDPAHLLAILGDLPEDAYQAQLAGAKAVREAAEAAALAAAEAAKVAAAAAEAARLQKEAEAQAERERLQREAEEAREAARLAKIESDRIAEEARVAAAAAKAEADRVAKEAAEAARVAKAEQDAKDAAAAETLRLEREAAAETARLAKVEQDRKDEEARKAKEAADAEIARLKKAAADKAAADKAEQDRKDAAAQAEADRVAKADAERQAAAKRAAAAPDREKLHAFATFLRGVTMPEPSTPQAQALMVKITKGLMEFADKVDTAADSLGAPPVA